ncbi:MAG: hypothetical protein CL848_04865 [Crocinitomicaceae bacterium]|nr:hypothetical protein [Crocinitomicaceae bacterium]
MRRRRDRLPRALPQVDLAALHPHHGAQHDRPGHVPLERVPVRVHAQAHAPRGGQEQRGQPALGAWAARRGLCVPGAHRLGQGLLAVCGLREHRGSAARAAHEPQRDAGAVRRHRAPAPAARAAWRVAREPGP